MKKIVGIILLIMIGICCKKTLWIRKEKNLENKAEMLAIYIEGEEVFDMPKKDSGYTLSSETSCNNGVTISWDDETWSSKVNYENYENTGERTRCNLYFEKIQSSHLDKSMIQNLSSSNISKIVIQNKITTPGEDASEEKNNGIILYTESNDNGGSTLYLQGRGKVMLSQDSSSLFSGFDMNTIEGMEYLDTSEVTDMSYMFSNCSRLTSLDISNFDTSNVVDMSHMFEMDDFYNNQLSSINLGNLDLTSVTDMSYMFSCCIHLTSIDLSDCYAPNLTNIEGMFSMLHEIYNTDSQLASVNLNNFKAPKITDMSNMFSFCSSLTNLDLSGIDTSNVTNMSNMFYYCISLTNLDLSSIDTSNVTNMSNMFSGCRSLTNLDLSSIDTSNVTNMSNMFSGCESLTNLVLSSIDTSNVTNMSNMFYNCGSLTNLDLSSFDTSNVTNMSNMFAGSEYLNNINVSSFNTSKVIDMSYMFADIHYGIASLDLSSFDTRNVTDFNYMFRNTQNLTQIKYGENFIYNNSADVQDMFSGTCPNIPTHSSWNGIDVGLGIYCKR